MKTLLEVKDLSIKIGSKRLVDSIGFSLDENQTLAIVGESGSGKSLTALSLLGLLPEHSKLHAQKIQFGSLSLLDLEKKAWQQLRGEAIGMVFQEPQSSLNPSMRCGLQVLEVLQQHRSSEEASQEVVLKAFEQVLLPDPKRIFKAYPHELSGGQKQRVMIAMALICQPKLLICDEPTTALDVTVQKEILALLKQLQQQYKMSILFISHDLSLVRSFADSVLVMQGGKIVEQGSAKSLFSKPQHPYTKGLLSARPPLDHRPERLITLADFLSNNTNVAIETPSTRKQHLEKLYRNTPLLEVQQLRKAYPQNAFFWQKKGETEVLAPISFEIYPSETLGLVGESGSGKSTLGRSLSYLTPPSGGQVLFEGEPISQKMEHTRQKLRKDIQFVFQDPYAALHPRKTIGQMLTEVLQHYKTKAINKRIEQLLEQVGLEKEMQVRYPHQLSGGQRQRAVIARALAPKPKLIICDEAVAALDISIQAQVLNLLNKLKKQLGLSYLFISHDMAVVRYVSDRILVLNKGKMETLQEADQLFQKPNNTYTQNLIEAIL
ncbi:MAG: dipeptide ABC transporter ATP-binding protein [Flavobacteriaceae bacterium]